MIHHVEVLVLLLIAAMVGMVARRFRVPYTFGASRSDSPVQNCHEDAAIQFTSSAGQSAPHEANVDGSTLAGRSVLGA